jgi:hypothetical protein
VPPESYLSGDTKVPTHKSATVHSSTVRAYYTTLTSTRRTLSRLRDKFHFDVLTKARLDYKKQATALRQKGQSTQHLRSSRPHASTQHSRLDMKTVVATWSTISSEDHTLRTSNWLVAYSANAWGRIVATPAASAVPHAMVAVPDPTCFICDRTYRDRDALTRHYHQLHVASAFNTPFNCPECARHLPDAVTIIGAAHWSNHVEQVHGRKHAPNLPSGVRTVASKPPCFVCGKRAGDLSRHYKQHCVELGSDSLFACPECPQAPATVDDLLVHLYADHFHQQLVRCAFCQLCCRPRAFQSHVKSHFNLEDPFLCAFCPAATRIKLADFNSWLVHYMSVHGGASKHGRKRSSCGEDGDGVIINQKIYSAGASSGNECLARQTARPPLANTPSAAPRQSSRLVRPLAPPH